ncbi:nucleoporin subcomplex protein binding to Pom34-domain-containing protein [Coniochaeta sp. 2T2.1]|nr:nucleoporin subcomplex protein binding to Pom34-domain-containing protein [Coniochaeta sp. 2T2.1]
MPASSDRIYFPPLEQCLTGESTLISWNQTASALADSSPDCINSTAVSDFLKDAQVHELLKTPSLVFGPPSSQSKAAFETKTAAINVTPVPTDKYDIKVIKEDALWLSKNTSVNESDALRVVVVEHQSRSNSHLTGPLSSQDVINVQEAAGVSSAHASSIFGAIDVSAAPDAETIWSDFDKEESRRARLIATLLSEQRAFTAAADAFITFILHRSPSFTGPEATALRSDIIKAAFGSGDGENVAPASFEPLLTSYISILPQYLSNFERISEKMDDKYVSSDLAIAAMAAGLAQATHALSLIFQILDQSAHIFASPEIVHQWFQFLDDTRFLSMINETDDTITELILPLRSLVCAISLTVLNTDRAVNFLDQEVELEEGEEAYLRSPDILSSINNTVMGAATFGVIVATPVMFAWSIILQRMSAGYQERAERRDLLQNQRAQDGFELENVRPSGGRRNSAGSIVSIEKSPYDIFLINSQLDRDPQGVELLAQAATSKGLVYDIIMDIANCAGSTEQAAFSPVVGSKIRLALVQLLKTSFPYVGYRAEPVTALLALLSGQQSYWNLSNDASMAPEQQVAALALKDSDLLNSYITESLNRYPYEFLPFTSYCKALSTCVCADDRSDLLLNFLLKTPTLTIVLGDDWNDYELAQEEDNSNTIRLIGDLPLFTPTSSWKRRTPGDQPFSIPAGTLGRFVTDNGKIALLEYEHSTVALLGKRLDVNLTPEAYHNTLGQLQPEEVAESVNLLATILRATVLRSEGLGPGQATEAGLNILQEASKHLPQNKDIISVITDTLDNYVQADLMSSDGAEIVIMSACLKFLHAALPLAPGRVWSYMARCELLYSASRSGRLSALTGALDILSERFELLQSSVNLFDGLVKSAMSSVVHRKSGIKTAGRQQTEESSWIGTSDKILGRVCLSIAQTSVDVFENSATWRFSPEIHRSIIVRDVVTVMDDLITSAFSIGSPENPGLTSFLSPAAKYIVESFLSSPSSGSLRFQPLIATLLVALQIPKTFLYPQRAEIISGRLTKALGFGSTLLRAADYLDQPCVALQTQLFKVSSLVARLYAAQDPFRLPALSLLGGLVESAGKGSSEPPSLLGYLGPQVSRSFIHILSKLDKPYDRPSTVSAVWKFFSSIMRNRQQWMGNCLLTGKTPREALEGDGKISKISPDSVLHVALEKLKAIGTLSSEEALVILDFFTSAQNYWPWTIFAMQKDNSFLEDLRRYVHDLKSPSVVGKTDPKEAGFQARIAAYIAETFAMQLYHLRQMGREEIFARDVVNDLDYFLRDGVQVSGYNKSLHVNFAKNFKSRYACSLDDFKTTSLVRRDLGPRYYYALDHADAMLSFDGGWIGPRQNGFRHEMETANLNLSLVDAQIALFHAWEYLLLELSVCLLPKKNQKVAKQMLQVAEKCLDSNQTSQAPEAIFARISQSRANLCLTLLQRLADRSLLPKDISQLLVIVAGTITSVENPFGEEQIIYFRTLLKILYVVLRGSTHSGNSDLPIGAKPQNPDASVAISQLVLNILDRVVAQGFRALVILVHESNTSTTPEDIALITAILQACLSIPGMDQCQTQILNIMASHDVLHVATSLFSWADKLADKGDPVYGELSLLFLLELSALPAVAEQLACDGLLSHITSASLAGFMRRPTVSPFSDNVGSARCYGIWAKGILPLLLNILGALGATIAPEVAFVLNQFPNLVRSAVDRFEAPGISRTATRETPHFVTLLAVSEIHSLSLLTRVLAALRANNGRDIPEVPFEAVALLENVEFWLRSRKVLRERLMPLSPREAEWRATKASEGSGCENRLEEKAVLQLAGVRDVLGEQAE